MTMQKGYKARIYPTKEQQNILKQTFGACRYVYNYYLAERIRSYKEEFCMVFLCHAIKHKRC